MRDRISAVSLAVLAVGLPAAARAEGPPSEIRIGQTMPYSGPASAYGVIGRVEAAYIDMINDKGGINGRKVKFISLDDAYSPPKTVEQTRRLVEQDEVMAVFGTVGTPTNLAVHKYLNNKKVPQLFVSTGATIWTEFKKYPWTIGWLPDYESEAKIYAKYVLKERPNGKIAILYQNDDSGRDYLRGFKAGLGADNAKRMIVAEASYQVSDATVDSQILTLQASGADVLFTHATPKFGAQAIRKVYEIGWKPLQLISTNSNTIAGTLAPAGLEKAQGLISAFILKDPSDSRWHNQPDYQAYLALLKKYAPTVDDKDSWAAYGYIAAQGLVKVLEQCGDDLSRENIMKQARNMDFTPGMLLPGIKAHTSPDNGYPPIKSMQLSRFEGTNWKPTGEVISGD
ncbi:ABC transporter substrate-binding protein [Chelatococcus reniformis]|uniref:ABC transporter substrate-binding protein n=1 Tax=Chelatococcus reniformis TaxID=1494448 RepID=A0A916XCX1_9HYPH|nr:ABC transporter substrate-binding protein [Chelatococcus reniformis]GGC62486.1 ABC transporter substrate-binding protein [Chelatococcus reniformis]